MKVNQDISLLKSADIKVKSGEELHLYNLSRTFNGIINIHLEDESKLIFDNAMINKDDIHLIINIYHDGENISSVINNNILNIEGRLNLEVNLIHHNNNSISNQYNKLINIDGISIIKPNLIVNNNKTEANHSAYIGPFKKEYYYYLATRGINYKDATILMAKALLKGKHDISDDFIEKETKCLEKILKY